LQHKTLVGYVEVFDLVVLSGIQHAVAVHREVPPEVDIVRVGAEALGPERLDDDFATTNGFEYFCIGQDHAVSDCAIGGCVILCGFIFFEGQKSARR
jgi:hypothetical protein